MGFPIDPTLQKSFRDTLGVPVSPSAFRDDDLKGIIPVAIVAQTTAASVASFVKITDGTNNVTATAAGLLNVNPLLQYPQQSASQTPKWFADGKAGVSTTAGTGRLLYTVTGGKTFYLTHLEFFMNTAMNPVQLEIRDSITLANTIKISTGSAPAQTASNGPQRIFMDFANPMQFTAGLFLDINTTGTCVVSGYGFEA